MKTRERILLTSLDLFNHEGEQNITTVDIANEMDISPGNLYYHFKGKESIIMALYQRFDNELSSLLHQSISDPLSLEEHWLFIYVVFEEIYKFRFFYLNSTELMMRYPELEKKFRRLMQLKFSTIETLCQNLIGQDALNRSTIDSAWLAETINLSVVYWFPYQQLTHPDRAMEKQIHQAVYHVLNLLVPYAGEQQLDFANAIQSLYKDKT
ncbi:MAG: TetR/AcrR family transcriptional regulator [Pseudomonadales bacterium]|nr:TetR/AcrR family transcriptional regulator [Pseudomonadales bacterium]